MKAIIILSLLLFTLPAFVVDLTKDKLIIFSSLSYYGCDFDGDKLGDLAVWDRKTNTLYFQLSSTKQFFNKRFIDSELPHDPVFADYDGDRKTDFVFFQPDSGQWVQYLSTNPVFRIKTFLGNIGDLPIPVDMNGDKKYEIGIWRPSAGIWAFPVIGEEKLGSYTVHAQGGASDSAFAPDFDGDGKSDFGIFRPESGYWFIDKSTTDYDPNKGLGIQHGFDWDIVVPNDYNGDGKCDVATWRPENQTWYFSYPETQSKNEIKFGEKGDIPLSLDINGDKIPELITYNVSKKSWNILNFKTNEHFSYKWEVPNGCIPAIAPMQKFE